MFQQTAQQKTNNSIISYWKTRLIRGGFNKTISIKAMAKTFFKKQKKFVKRKDKTKNIEETQPTPTNNKNYHTEENKDI